MKKILFLFTLLNIGSSFSQGITARDLPFMKTAVQAVRLISSIPQVDVTQCAIVSTGIVCCCVGGSLGYCAKEGCPIAFLALLAFLEDSDVNNKNNSKKKNPTFSMSRD